MYRDSWMRTLALGAMLPAILFFAGCRPETLASVWHASSSVRANERDWWNLPAYRVKNFAGRITVVNDSSDLCLGLYSSDRHLAHRLRGSGLTVWLTNAQNKSEKLGIRYPIGRQKGEREFRPNRFLPNENLPPSEMGAMLQMPNDEIEILAEDSTRSGRKSVDEAEQLGLSARLTEADSAVAYLLTIEMAQLVPWLRPGSKVLLEIESPVMERAKPEDRRFSDERGGGRGGMPPSGGGGGFPPGGGRGGQHRGPSEGRDQRDDAISADRAIHLSFMIDLAAKPTS
jgi:hypothetical protein